MKNPFKAKRTEITEIRRYNRVCYLCKQFFLATSPSFRFCKPCRKHSELYRFHDWLFVGGI